MRLTRFVLMAGLVASGCGGPTVDLSKSLQIDVVETGWYDAGIVNGQNKLVPAAKITVKNNSDQKLVQLQINSMFRHGTTGRMGQRFHHRCGFGWPRLRRNDAATSAEVAERLHGYRSDAAGHAEELTIHGRADSAVREIWVDPMGTDGRAPDQAPAAGEIARSALGASRVVSSTHSVMSASVPSLDREQKE